MGLGDRERGRYFGRRNLSAIKRTKRLNVTQNGTFNLR